MHYALCNAPLQLLLLLCVCAMRLRMPAPPGQVCYVLDSWLPRHYASDFLADSELFADCCAFLAQWRAHVLAHCCRTTTVATPPRCWRAAAAAHDGGDLLRAQRHAVDERFSRARLPAQGQPVRDDAEGD
jgi:hypothetical protein